MTVILMVDRRRERGGRALRSLLEQPCIGRLEVLLVDFAGRQAPPLAGADHPAVRRVFLPRGTGYGAAKARGVTLARAPIVAFFEEHCVAAPGWAEAILEAHDGPFAGVGGEAHNAAPGLGMTEFVALMCSGPWSPPAIRGEAPAIPGNNSSYKRDVLLRYEPDLASLLGMEALLQERLRRDGHALSITPDAAYAHAFEDRALDFCRTVYLYQRVSDATRSRIERWTARRKLVYVGRAAPMLALLPLRSLVHLAKTRPRRVATVLPYLHVFLLSRWCGVLGGVLGVVRGLGGADVRLLDYDLNTARREADEPMPERSAACGRVLA